MHHRVAFSSILLLTLASISIEGESIRVPMRYSGTSSRQIGFFPSSFSSDGTESFAALSMETPDDQKRLAAIGLEKPPPPESTRSCRCFALQLSLLGGGG